MRTCKNCGELLEVKTHTNVDNPDKQTLEIQECISCSWTTTVKL
jgi:hypothetical protein